MSLEDRPKPPEMSLQDKIDLLYIAGCVLGQDFLIRMGHDLSDPEEIKIELEDKPR